MLDQVPDLDAILVSVGGGGVISGVGAWVKHAKPDCKGYQLFLLAVKEKFSFIFVFFSVWSGTKRKKS